MEHKHALYEHKKEIALYQRRTIIASITILTLTAVLIARVIYLQIWEHQHYTTLSKNNQLTLLPLPPNRGTIYDRNGTVVAENIVSYNLQVTPEKIDDIPATVHRLKSIIDITPADISRFEKLKKRHRRFNKVLLKQKLTNEEVARFYVNQPFFPGVTAEIQLTRHYPYASDMVDIIGYVSRINEQELAQIDPSSYAGTHYIGKNGIEKYFENTLHGKVGNQQVEVNANGRIIRVIKSEPAITGHDLYLTIDLHLQQAAKKALEGEKGAIVAIAPKTGEILALASYPSYDPNRFVQGMSTKDYTNLQHSPGKPLYNRAIRGQYPLASTIKPFLAIQGLDTGFADMHRKIQDPGWYKLNASTQVYRDWKKKGHGLVSLSKAIIVSCDTFFYDLAYRMGINHIHNILSRFGFGETSGIEIQEELPGLVPSPRWKYATYGDRWYPGDTVITGIGQGYLLTTPVQLAAGTAIIANRGKRMLPHLLLKQQLPDGTEIYNLPTELTGIDIAPKYWDYVIKSMQNVIVRGTARGRFGVAPYTAAGKTGTAQVAKIDTLKERYGNDIPEHLRDHTLFIAFAPVHDPKIAVAAIIENSRSAVDITRKVIDSYLLDERKDNADKTETIAEYSG